MGTDRGQATSHDHHHIGERERDLADDLSGGAQVDQAERNDRELGEDDQQRDRHHDLGRDQRYQHQ